MNKTAFTYNTISGSSEALFKDRGSRFLAFGFPAPDTETVKRHLQQLRKAHTRANHCCYAFRIGTNSLLFRAADDGEPSGSAGRPILGQIDSAGLTNVLVAVVRYFGGTLLGVPGLIHAYKTAAADCLAAATIVEKNIEAVLEISFQYALINDVMQVLKQQDVSFLKQEMSLFCRYEVGIPIRRKEICIKKLEQIYGVTVATQDNA